MMSINILLLIGVVSTYGQPLKTTETSLSDQEYGLQMTSETSLMDVQSETEQGSEVLPINKDIYEKVLAKWKNNTIVNEASFVTLLKEIFPEAASTNNSTENDTAFLKVLKAIFPPDALTEDSTFTPLYNDDYEDKIEDEYDEMEEDADPEGLGPRLSATLLKILTF